MKRLCVLVVPMAAFLLATGCADPKQKKIDELSGELQQVKGDLAAAKQAQQQAQDALTKYQQDLQGAQGERDQALASMSDLQARLQAAEAARNAAGGGKVQRRPDGWVITPGAAMISIKSDLLFASGKAELTAAGQKKIAEVASEIRKEYSSRDIYVIGFTDTDPIRKTHWKDNWDLGAERSLTVLRLLQSSGVRPEHLVQAGRGQYHPVSREKAENRRVEIYAVEAAQTRNVSASSGTKHTGKPAVKTASTKK